MKWKKGRFARAVSCAALVASAGVSQASDAQAQVQARPEASLGGRTDGFIEGILTSFAEELDRHYRLPSSLIFTNRACGQPDAFFMASGTPSGQAEVVLCNELVTQIFANAQSRRENELDGVYRVVSQIFFVLAHETGHALVELLDLPVAGRGESLADQFASIGFEAEPLMAVYAARLFAELGFATGLEPRKTFAGTHGLSEERVYEFLCWVHAADVQTRSWVLETLPGQEGVTCGSSYARSRSEIIALLTPHLRTSVEDAFGDLAEARDLSGAWDFTESINGSGSRCTAGGHLWIGEFLDEFTGRWSLMSRCVANGEAVEANTRGEIVSGSVNDGAGTVRFSARDCAYSGRFTDDTMMMIRGEVSCGGGSAAGSWAAVRQ